MRRLPLEFSVGPSTSADGRPERRVPARVPGAVQLDWARAHDLPDPLRAADLEHYRPLEDLYWSYAALLPRVELAPDELVFLVCRGVDYACSVRLEQQLLYEHEGMITPFDVDLTGRFETGAELEIRVHPAPKGEVALEACKPPVGYGTDFHPHLVPLGLWDETYLEVRPRRHLRRSEVFYELADDLRSASVVFAVEASSEGGAERVRLTLISPDGSVVLQREAALVVGLTQLECQLDRVELWWPNGQGRAALYQASFELVDGAGQVRQRQERRVGFRRVRLVQYEGARIEPRFPFTQLEPPITVEVNGRRIFAKGSNFAPVDVFPGTLTEARYRELLELARDAHFNVVRAWGGSAPQKEAFFAVCDELGIFVWQDFMVSSQFRASPGYLRVLEQESRSTVLRLRQHACLLLWCGGNELLGYWHGMTEQDAPLRLVSKVAFELDPGRPFLASTPIMGMGHGSYVFRETSGREVFQIYAESHCTALPEFGVPGPANAETLRAILPSDELFPPSPGGAWQAHFAYRAWKPHPEAWLNYALIEEYFGPCRTLEELVERGQLLQAEGLRFAFEEARRQKPRCALAMNWCFGEPWPCAANGSLVGYPCRPKLALAAAKAACRPVLASARVPKFSWSAGERLCADIFVLNDAVHAQAGGIIDVTLRCGAEVASIGCVEFPSLAANQNFVGPSLHGVVPTSGAGSLRLDLTVRERPSWNSTYTLALLQ